MNRILLFLFIFISVYSASGQISVGDSAIDFSLPDTTGRFFSLSDFTGNIILLNFFATWCPPCRVEAPQLEDSIWQVFRSQGVTVIGMDFMESVPPIREFTQEFGLTYPILRDTAGTIFSEYDLTVFPSNVLIDRDGQIAWVEAGFNIPRFVNLIDSLLQVTSLTAGSRPATTPQNLEIISTFPNPFNSRVNIQIRVLRAGPISLKVYDVTGRRLMVKELFLASGEHVLPIEMNRYSSGMYFFALASGGQSIIGRFVLQK